jgi:ubiquinone biosynthesis accessory factor UbiJ
MLYLILEKAINHLLTSDPDTVQRLRALSGKVVKISVTDWQMDCYCLLEQGNMRLVRDYSGLVDTTIRGKLTGLVRLGLSKASGPTLFDEGIEVIGDADLGEKIRDILRRVDLDGEEYLSRWVGDVPAHELSWRIKHVVESGKGVLRKLRQNVCEFLQIEGQYLPTRSQVEHFYRQVAHLRDDVERAAQRLARLEKK